MSYSKQHYKLLNASETAEQAAARVRWNKAHSLAMAERPSVFPKITEENESQVEAWYERRIRELLA